METSEFYGLCENIASYVWENKDSMTNSLYEGKTGAAVLFYELYRFSGEEKYEDMANHLIGSVASNIDLQDGKSFSLGALGVGWSLSILQKNDFIELEEKEVFTQIDIVAIFHACEGYGIKRGFLGVATYLLQRLEDKSILQSEFHVHYEKIIEVNEILSECIKERIQESSLYSYDELPYLLSYVRVSSEQEFLSTLAGLVHYYDKLIDVNIQPEISLLNLTYTINVINHILKFLLSDEFITAILPRDKEERVVIYLIFELYTALQVIKHKRPDINIVQNRTLLDEKMYFLLSKIQITDMGNERSLLLLKHLILLRRLTQYLKNESVPDYDNHPISKHLSKLNAALAKEFKDQLMPKKGVTEDEQKWGISGLSGLGLYFLALTTDVNENYYNALGI